MLPTCLLLLMHTWLLLLLLLMHTWPLLLLMHTWLLLLLLLLALRLPICILLRWPQGLLEAASQCCSPMLVRKVVLL
jgi:hypothetical protein